MAEAAGLVLAGLAIPSVLTACLELIEQYDKGKFWIYDLSLALIKVKLLRTRLQALQEYASGSAVADSAAKTLPHIVASPSDELPAHHAVLADGLAGISEILQRTNGLCMRYCTAPGSKTEPEQATRRWLTPCEASQPENAMQAGSQAGHTTSFNMKQKDSKKSGVGRLRAASFGLSARRSTSSGSLAKRLAWAVYDKKRFDSLIADFDFFLSSMETITTQLERHKPSFSNPSADTALEAPQSEADSVSESDLDTPSIFSHRSNSFSSTSLSSPLDSSSKFSNPTERMASHGEGGQTASSQSNESSPPNQFSMEIVGNQFTDRNMTTFGHIPGRMHIGSNGFGGNSFLAFGSGPRDVELAKIWIQDGGAGTGHAAATNTAATKTAAAYTAAAAYTTAVVHTAVTHTAVAHTAVAHTAVAHTAVANKSGGNTARANTSRANTSRARITGRENCTCVNGPCDLGNLCQGSNDRSLDWHDYQ